MDSNKQTLLLCRLAPKTVDAIAANPFVREKYNLVALHQLSIDKFDHNNLNLFIEDRPHHSEPERTVCFLNWLLSSTNTSCVMASQYGLWYSDILKSVANDRKIPVYWTEVLFNDRITCDTQGTVYTPTNSISLMCKTSEPFVIEKTRYEKQPEKLSRDQILNKYNILTGCPVVVFGQTPIDMAVKHHRNIPYHEWLNQVFLSNPDHTFLFKHHPEMKTELPLEIYHNVIVIDENVESLLDSFEYFASFSSSTIFEAVYRGKKVMTGGYHSLTGTGVVMESSLLVVDLMEFDIDADIRQNWISTIHHEYSIDPMSEQLMKRLDIPPD